MYPSHIYNKVKPIEKTIINRKALDACSDFSIVDKYEPTAKQKTEERSDFQAIKSPTPNFMRNTGPSEEARKVKTRNSSGRRNF
jgi:hypothetical protein